MEHMQLKEEYAAMVLHLPPRQVEEFASGLKSKRMSALSSMVPATYTWLKKNQRDVIDAFCDVGVSSRIADRLDICRRFVDFINECRDFYPGIPSVLCDVARLEFLLMSLMGRQEPTQKRSASADVGPGFSWDSLYWRPSRTSAVSFSADALSILLGKKEMVDCSDPTWMVVAAGPSDGRPTILRITESAFHVFGGLDEPISARALLEYAENRQLNVSQNSLKALLMRLDQSNVIDSYYIHETATYGS
ncbi:hypothetical protein ACPZ13_19470 [Streptomyces sp. IPPR8]|uniref:hypothetical protein n=1 Tax=unclassified Streptomyces TaxID=2593676 RepID=UPI001E4C94A9|nr:hypothetical protein [Streptomyces sp. DH1]